MNISDNVFNISNDENVTWEDFTIAPNMNTDPPINQNESDALIYCILAVLGVLAMFSPMLCCICKEITPVPFRSDFCSSFHAQQT